MTRVDLLIETLARLRLAAAAIGVHVDDIQIEDIEPDQAERLRQEAVEDFRALINGERRAS